MKKFVRYFALLVAVSFVAPHAAAAQDEAVVTNRYKTAAPLSFPEIMALLRPEIMKIPTVRGIEVDKERPNSFRIIHSKTLTVTLDNLQKRLNARGANRQAELNKFIEIISKAVAKSDPFKVENLRIILRTKEAIDDFEQMTAFGGANNFVVRRPFIGDIEEIIVAETKSAISFMPQSRLSDLKLTLEDAFNVAEKGFLTNAAATQWIVTPENLMQAKLDGAFETGLLTIPSFWQDVEQKKASPIALIVPNRGLVLIGDANSAEDMEKLANIAKKEAVGPHALTDKILLWKSDHWEFTN